MCVLNNTGFANDPTKLFYVPNLYLAIQNDISIQLCSHVQEKCLLKIIEIFVRINTKVISLVFIRTSKYKLIKNIKVHYFGIV